MCEQVVCGQVVCVSKLCVDKLRVDKLCVSKLCVDKLCVDKLCVSKLLCVDKLCVSKLLCVHKLCVSKRTTRGGGRTAGYRTKNKNPTQRCGEQNQLQPVPESASAWVIPFNCHAYLVDCLVLQFRKLSSRESGSKNHQSPSASALCWAAKSVPQMNTHAFGNVAV